MTGSGPVLVPHGSCSLHSSRHTFTMHEDPARSFLKLFTPELLQLVVVETNRFALHCSMESSREPPPTPWMTTVDEMKALIGFSVLMGVVKLPGPLRLLVIQRGTAMFSCGFTHLQEAHSRASAILALCRRLPSCPRGVGLQSPSEKWIPQLKLCGTPFLQPIYPTENVPLTKQW